MAHEDLTREHAVERSSERSFGLVFAAAFLVFACWPLLHGGRLRAWALAVAALLALLALARPRVFVLANRGWTALGLLLGRIVSPIALGIVYYGVLTPVGLLMRLTGSDPMRRRREQAVASYWISRQPPGPPPDSMHNQF